MPWTAKKSTIVRNAKKQLAGIRLTIRGRSNKPSRQSSTPRETLLRETAKVYPAEVIEEEGARDGAKKEFDFEAYKKIKKSDD